MTHFIKKEALDFMPSFAFAARIPFYFLPILISSAFLQSLLPPGGELFAAEKAKSLPFPVLKIEPTEKGSRLHLAAASAETGTPASYPWPSTLEIPLFELEPLGTLKSLGTQIPLFFVAQGRNCKSCDDDDAIFVIQLEKGIVSSFLLPGKIYDRKSRATLYDSQAYFGNCLRNSDKEGLVIFQRDRVDRRRGLRRSVYIAEAGESFLHERLVARRLPQEDHSKRLVRQKKCTAIKGESRPSSARVISLVPKADQEETEDTPPKENQTQSELPSPSESIPDASSEESGKPEESPAPSTI